MPRPGTIKTNKYNNLNLKTLSILKKFLSFNGPRFKKFSGLFFGLKQIQNGLS